MEELQTIKNRNLTSCSKSLLTYVNNLGCEQESNLRHQILIIEV